MTAPARASKIAAAFDARATRAGELARKSATAEEPLRFAAGLLRAQAKAASAIDGFHAARPLSGSLADDLDRMLAPLLDVATFVAREAPKPLASEALERAREDEPLVRTRLSVFWNGDRKAREHYLSRAMLRPYAEVLRANAVAVQRLHAEGRCPFCGSGPAVGCRRGGSASEGAARLFVCALCGLEWPSLRILCPACLERDPTKLPAFTSDKHPAVRLEACETCRRYVKSFDLSDDARPVPEIDDLASLALDLWAIEQGFTRIEPGLAGL